MSRLALAATVLPLLAQQPAQPPGRPPILGLAHVSIFVSDLAAARSFYKDFLGFDEVPRKVPASGEKLAIIKVNDHQYINLVAEPPRNFGNLSHVGFYTDDVEGMRSYLASRGVKVPETVRKDKLGDSSISFPDPDGHSMEIVQYRSDGLAGETEGKYMPADRVADHFDHVGVLFNDKETAIRFYTDMFGLKLYRGPRLTFLSTNDPLDRFEIGTDKQPRSPERFGIKNHICLSTPDAVKAVAALSAKPIAKKYRTVEAHLLGGKHVANYYDPDGTRVELMEPGATDANETR